MTIRAQAEPQGQDITVNTTAAALNGLSTEIGEWAQGKGFREDWELSFQLESIAKLAEQHSFGHIVFRLDGDDNEHTVADELRKAAVALRNNVVGMKLMLIVSELAEALETLRDHGIDAIMADKLGNIGEELADAEIRILDLAHQLKQPIGDETMAKVEKNGNRPYKHGRQL